jgi:hypothetical protein
MLLVASAAAVLRESHDTDALREVFPATATTAPPASH